MAQPRQSPPSLKPRKTTGKPGHDIFETNVQFVYLELLVVVTSNLIPKSDKLYVLRTYLRRWASLTEEKTGQSTVSSVPQPFALASWSS
jgi:hypothetical protein